MKAAHWTKLWNMAGTTITELLKNLKQLFLKTGFKLFFIRWKDAESARGYDHLQEDRKIKISKSLLGKMTVLEQQDLCSSPSLPNYKILESNGLKVKFRKILTSNANSQILNSHTGSGSQEVLPSLPASEFS